jgi:hypothetical protein
MSSKHNRRSRPRQLPPCVPDDIHMDGILWAPDATEVKLARALVRQRFYEQELRLAELAEQRDWLPAAIQRSVAAGLLIDEMERKLAIQAEMDRTDKWYADTAAKEKKQSEAILAAYQKQLDGGKYETMVERANKAKADMDRDNARLERLALLKKGVLRGRRKEFAAMPTWC